MKAFVTMWRKDQPWLFWFCAVSIPFSAIRLIAALWVGRASMDDLSQLSVWLLVALLSAEIAWLRGELRAEKYGEWARRQV